MQATDPTQVRVLEAGALQAIAGRPIHPDVGDEDRTGQDDPVDACPGPDPEHAQAERPVVDEVVGQRPEPGIPEVADHRDVRDEQQRQDEQPRSAVDAVQDQAGDEGGDRLEAQPGSG